MIELQNNALIFTFPEIRDQLRVHVHAWVDARLSKATNDEKARLPGGLEDLYRYFEDYIPDVRASIDFQRTLRIPDDGKDYHLPPGLGRFPVHHVDDFEGVSEKWRKRGGVMLPMYQTEAMWLSFSGDYPMALMIGAGGICAVSGRHWMPFLHMTPQNYVVIGEQPWLDGFRVSSEVIRQFVAVPMGKGLTVEHQLTGEESWGGFQLQAFPFHANMYWIRILKFTLDRRWKEMVTPPEARILYTLVPQIDKSTVWSKCVARSCGVGAGGRMKQEIIADPHGIAAWESSLTSRCYVHLCAATDWQRLTGTPPPQKPPTAQDYTKAGLPWFDYDAGQPPVEGTTPLSTVKSVNTLVGDMTGLELTDNAALAQPNVVKLHPDTNRKVREF